MEFEHMVYVFRLEIGREGSRLSVMEGKRRISSREWPEARDMGRQLFEAIAAILAETGLAPTDIASFDVETDVSDNFTSVRIGQAVSAAYGFGVSALSADVPGEGGEKGS